MSVTTRAAGVVFGGLVLLAGCAGSTSDDAVDFKVPVTVREVTTGTVEDRVVATGTLRATEVASLRAETSGTLHLARVAGGRRVSEGDAVSAGEIVAEIRGEDVRIAARTEATETAYREAERDYDSRKTLFDEGLIPESELRAAATRLAQAKIDWERSRLTEDRSRLRSPIDGIVLHLARDEQDQPLADGQLVAQGLVVAQVAPVDRLVADVDLVGADVARVRPGLEARLEHPAWPDRVFAGRVVRLAPALNPATRTLRAEVAVDNRDRLLRPGMFAEVTIVAARHEGVAVVPREAVTERQGISVVFVVEGQKVSKRPVRLGLGDDEVVEVLDGVAPGERVVVRGIETLDENVKVRVAGS